MGQSKPFRATALIVEDDAMQREMICRAARGKRVRRHPVRERRGRRARARSHGRHAVAADDRRQSGRPHERRRAREDRASRHPALDVVVTSGKPLNGSLPDGVQVLVQAVGGARRAARGGAGAGGAAAEVAATARRRPGRELPLPRVPARMIALAGCRSPFCSPR